MDCPPDKIVFDPQRAEYICTETGEVIEERVPTGIGVKQSVETVSTFAHDYNLYSVIGNTKAMTPNERIKLLKLSWNQKKSRVRGNNRSLITMLVNLERLALQLHLPERVINYAISLGRKLHEQRYHVTDHLILSAALLFLSCRINQYPIIISDLSKIIERNQKQILREYNNIVLFLKIKVPPPDPNIYFRYAESKLGDVLTPDIINMATRLMDYIRKTNKFQGMRSQTLVAIVLYISSLRLNKPIPAKSLCEVFSISEVTLFAGVRKINNFLKNTVI